MEAPGLSSLKTLSPCRDIRDAATAAVAAPQLQRPEPEDAAPLEALLQQQHNSNSIGNNSNTIGISSRSSSTIGGILVLHKGTRGQLRRHKALQGVFLQQLDSDVQTAAAVFEPPCPLRLRLGLLQAVDTLASRGQEQQQQQQQETKAAAATEAAEAETATGAAPETATLEPIGPLTAAGSPASAAGAAAAAAVEDDGSIAKPTRCICLFGSNSCRSSARGSSKTTLWCRCCCIYCSSSSSRQTGDGDGCSVAAESLCCSCSTCCSVALRYIGGPQITSICCIEQQQQLLKQQQQPQQQQLLLTTAEGALLSVTQQPRCSSSELKCLRVGSSNHTYSVSGGVSFALIHAAGGLFGLGTCSQGQLLQQEPVSCCFIPRLLPFAAAVASRCSIAALSCSKQHVVAAAADGRCFTWGSNCCGELGLGTTGPPQHKPKLLPLQQPVTAVAAGEGFSLAAAAAAVAAAASPAAAAGAPTNGAVWAWGLNCYGQLGLGDTKPRYLPQQILHASCSSSSCCCTSSNSSTNEGDMRNFISVALPPIVQLAAGDGFAALLAAGGALLLQGRPPSRCADTALQHDSSSACCCDAGTSCGSFPALCGDTNVPSELLLLLLPALHMFPLLLLLLLLLLPLQLPCYSRCCAYSVSLQIGGQCCCCCCCSGGLFWVCLPIALFSRGMRGFSPRGLRPGAAAGYFSSAAAPWGRRAPDPQARGTPHDPAATAAAAACLLLLLLLLPEARRRSSRCRRPRASRRTASAAAAAVP